jgi:hypothetical protein
MADKETLCELEKSGFLRDKLPEYKDLVKKGKFVCKRCDRVARKKARLCRPEKI